MIELLHACLTHHSTLCPGPECGLNSLCSPDAHSLSRSTWLRGETGRHKEGKEEPQPWAAPGACVEHPHFSSRLRPQVKQFSSHSLYA